MINNKVTCEWHDVYGQELIKSFYQKKKIN